MKQKSSVITLIFVIIIGFMPTSFAENFVNDKGTKAIFIGDVNTGEVIYKKNEDEVLPVASMSKLMTYLVVKDEISKGNIKLSDTVLITKESADLNIPGYSRMYLKKDDAISVKTLIEGLILVSANDGANALAIHVAGSLEAFVKMMQEKAKEIGLKKAEFINPSGLTEKGPTGQLIYNKMTARDMFDLARHISKKYPEIEEFSKYSTWFIPEKENLEKKPFFNNLGMPSMLGLKSGYTDEAGSCYTGLFDFSKEDTKNNLKIITVVIGASDTKHRNDLTAEIATKIRDGYSQVDILKKDVPFIDKYDSGSKQKRIPLYPEKDFSKIVDLSKNFKIEYKLYDHKKAPYKDGEELGELKISIDSETVETVKLVNRGYVDKLNFFSNIYNGLKDFFKNIMLLF